MNRWPGRLINWSLWKSDAWSLTWPFWHFRPCLRPAASPAGLFPIIFALSQPAIAGVELEIALILK